MSFYYKNESLYCEDVEIRKIAEEIKTPFYLYSLKTIVKNFNEYKEAFAEKETLICYAYKANSNICICNILKELGAGAEVVSGGELFKALHIKTPPEKIVFNGNGKNETELIYALTNKIFFFNIDSKQELLFLEYLSKQYKKKANIAIRINLEVDVDTHSYIVTSGRRSKFGLSPNNAIEVYKLAKNFKYINPIGIHIHIGSQITTINPYIQAIKELKKIYKELKDIGIEIKYFNLGGGLGIKYSPEQEVISIKEFGRNIISNIDEDVGIILEPGRSIIGPAGILISKVLYIKERRQKKILVIDAGMNDLIRPALYRSRHRILPLVDKGEDNEILVDIVGPICESADVFVYDSKICFLPKQGDYLAIMDTGAYGFSMASNYNLRPKPPEVLVNKDKYYIIRERESFDDLITKEKIPKELLSYPADN